MKTYKIEETNLADSSDNDSRILIELSSSLKLFDFLRLALANLLLNSVSFSTVDDLNERFSKLGASQFASNFC